MAGGLARPALRVHGTMRAGDAGKGDASKGDASRGHADGSDDDVGSDRMSQAPGRPAEARSPRPRQVLCVKWGTKYGAEYPNRLYGMVRRNVTGPLRFVCMADTAEGLRPEIEHLALPPLSFELRPKTRGIWGKSRLWAERIGDLSGPVLFMDLDLVVVGPLDRFFDHGREDDVILARNPNRPLERLGQTSLYRFPVGGLTALEELFLKDPQGTADAYTYEQRFVTRNVPGGVALWPRGWVDFFKWHCVPQFPLNYLRAPRPRRDASVVVFAGSLNPPDAIEGRWKRNETHRPPLAHVAAGLRGERKKSLLKHTHDFLWPSPWIAEHWRE